MQTQLLHVPDVPSWTMAHRGSQSASGFHTYSDAHATCLLEQMSCNVMLAVLPPCQFRIQPEPCRCSNPGPRQRLALTAPSAWVGKKEHLLGSGILSMLINFKGRIADVTAGMPRTSPSRRPGVLEGAGVCGRVHIRGPPPFHVVLWLDPLQKLLPLRSG